MSAVPGNRPDGVWGDLPAPSSVPHPFTLLSRVLSWDARRLVAISPASGPAGELHETWRLLEAAAQAASLHQRVLRDFSDHAFLLGVDAVPLPMRVGAEAPVLVTAILKGQSAGAAAYRLSLAGLDDEGHPGEEIAFGLLIGHAAYDDSTFRRATLEGHYRERFRWLLGARD